MHHKIIKVPANHPVNHLSIMVLRLGKNGRRPSLEQEY
uniref:Uncharacterized protein n=1 Tax=Rhizophora mucronata TaxID=61149 RepID=A0A2P2NF38_RHIMU